VEFRPWRYDSIREHTAAFERVALCTRGPQSAIARRLHGELRRPLNEVSALTVEALVLEVAGEASRPTRSAREAPAWLQDVREFLHDDFRVIRRVSQVADVAGVHPVHLARVFRATFGCSIGSYVRRLRLESAAADLARSSRPISAIALDAGFSDQSHFTHAFTAFFGRSPAVYRRENDLARVSGRPRVQPPEMLDPDKAR
jgi:AraC family transcriptional regulator